MQPHQGILSDLENVRLVKIVHLWAKKKMSTCDGENMMKKYDSEAFGLL